MSTENSKRISVLVKYLRKIGYENFKEWLTYPENIYVGRKGRIFVDKLYFQYSGSKWANPYKVGKNHYTLKKSLKLYKKYLINNLLKENNIEELRGKNLGCFCDKNNKCHVDVLINQLNRTDENEDDEFDALGGLGCCCCFCLAAKRPCNAAWFCCFFC